MRLRTALLAYALLALLAGLTLDGAWRAAVWVLMAGLAVKTWIAEEKRRRDERASPDQPEEGS
jgi:hypothetical protein